MAPVIFIDPATQDYLSRGGNERTRPDASCRRALVLSSANLSLRGQLGTIRTCQFAAGKTKTAFWVFAGHWSVQALGDYETAASRTVRTSHVRREPRNQRSSRVPLRLSLRSNLGSLPWGGYPPLSAVSSRAPRLPANPYDSRRCHRDCESRKTRTEETRGQSSQGVRDFGSQSPQSVGTPDMLWPLEGRG